MSGFAMATGLGPEEGPRKAFPGLVPSEKHETVRQTFWGERKGYMSVDESFPRAGVLNKLLFPSGASGRLDVCRFLTHSHSFLGSLDHSFLGSEQQV